MKYPFVPFNVGYSDLCRKSGYDPCTSQGMPRNNTMSSWSARLSRQTPTNYGQSCMLERAKKWSWAELLATHSHVPSLTLSLLVLNSNSVEWHPTECHGIITLVCTESPKAMQSNTLVNQKVFFFNNNPIIFMITLIDTSFSIQNLSQYKCFHGCHSGMRYYFCRNSQNVEILVQWPCNTAD